MNYSNIVLLFLLSFALSAQTVKDLDFVAPMEDGYAAVKKGETWGFIDEEGELVISFREDLVANAKAGDQNDLGVAGLTHPVMVEDRCIVKAIKNGIPYYGYINAFGTIAIEPQFLNVSVFKNGYALALKVEETVLGKNEPLGKRVVRYAYDIVLIDRYGQEIQYLAGPFPIALSAEKLKTAPPIIAKDIAEDIIAVRAPDTTWSVIKID
jgi:hypothetical protein